MSRALHFLTPQRLAAGVSAAVGWTLGMQIVQGGFDGEGVLWAAIAVLGLVQLRLLVPSRKA